MFLQNNYKKNMARVNCYLLDIKESIRLQLNILENDIARNNKIIKESNKSLKQIRSSFDTSYLVLSSSQVAKANEYAEIDSLQEIIAIREKEIEDLNIRKEELMEKLHEVEEVIACSNSIKELLDEKSFT